MALKWISLSITNVPMQDNAYPATRGNQICCSIQEHIKDVTWMSSDSQTLSAAAKEGGMAQQRKLIQSNNCHSWECQEEVYNGSAAWL